MANEETVNGKELVFKGNLPVIENGATFNWLCVKLLKGGFAPGYQSPEQVACAVMHGADLGFTPFQSVQSIQVIKGRPSLTSDAALALCWSSGKLKMYDDGVENDGTEKAVAWVTVERDGGSKIKRTFSVADAKTAGLWGTNNWKTYPRDMLLHRARGRALRTLFSDVLRGLHIAEELKDEPGENTARVRAAVEDLAPKPLIDADGRTVPQLEAPAIEHGTDAKEPDDQSGDLFVQEVEAIMNEQEK